LGNKDLFARFNIYAVDGATSMTTIKSYALKPKYVNTYKIILYTNKGMIFLQCI